MKGRSEYAVAGIVARRKLLVDDMRAERESVVSMAEEEVVRMRERLGRHCTSYLLR